MDREFLERVQQAIPSAHGSSGGVSQAIRELLHVVLDEPIPLQWGEKERDSPVEEVETEARELERAGKVDVDRINDLKTQVKVALKKEKDRIPQLRLLVVLGRLASMGEE